MWKTIKRWVWIIIGVLMVITIIQGVIQDGLVEVATFLFWMAVVLAAMAAFGFFMLWSLGGDGDATSHEREHVRMTIVGPDHPRAVPVRRTSIRAQADCTAEIVGPGFGRPVYWAAGGEHYDLTVYIP